MANTPSLKSRILRFAVSVIRTRQLSDFTFGTVHAYFFVESGMLDAMLTHCFPLSVVYSIFTFVTSEDVHLILCVVSSGPLFTAVGEVNCMSGSAEIENVALLVSYIFR